MQNINYLSRKRHKPIHAAAGIVKLDSLPTLSVTHNGINMQPTRVWHRMLTD